MVSQTQPEKILTPAMPDRVGTVRITGRIGRGAMGEVYQGQDEELGRPVAVKFLPTSPDAESKERFDREALALARLTHVNVVGVYTKGMLEGRPYFTMELVDGPSVQDILDGQGPFSVEEAWEILRQAALGLEAAQQAGVTHRDIKPANLLVAKDGTIKVADFGVCKIAGLGPAMTEDGTTLGTPYYMAPEQARGEAVDHRSDQYALGATFFHLVSGRPPFGATQTMAQLLAHQKQPPPDIHDACPQVSKPVARVVARMLEKRPEQRFASYSDMLVAMEDALSQPPERPYARPVLWGGALVVTGALAGLLAWSHNAAPGVEEAEDTAPSSTAASQRPAQVQAAPRVAAPVVAVVPAPVKAVQPTQDAPAVEAKEAPVDSVVQAISQEHGAARAQAMRTLARSRDAKAVQVLGAILKDAKDEDAPMAAVLLGEMGNQDATGALSQALYSSRRATVLAAVDALVHLRDVRAVEPLKALSESHEDATVRARAKRAGQLLFAVDGEK